MQDQSQAFILNQDREQQNLEQELLSQDTQNSQVFKINFYNNIRENICSRNNLLRTLAFSLAFSDLNFIIKSKMYQLIMTNIMSFTPNYKKIVHMTKIINHLQKLNKKKLFRQTSKITGKLRIIKRSTYQSKGSIWVKFNFNSQEIIHLNRVQLLELLYLNVNIAKQKKTIEFKNG
ncbi:unnamed protein product [Paramecium pentaurelia]|uniref:Uncharacterized protein n=1 Tax=Paramecium pentaurelia TaxID=43138 RepID=A0A8S1VR61_9CILI|nr:unnamed protein product [Paramecium pentaurelia]